MYCLKEYSLETDDPVFFKIRKDCTFFPSDKVIARDWAARGNYEDGIIQWAKSLIDPSKVFLDIGAHVGTYSMGLATACAGVHSFECCPRTHNMLCANIALRELDYKIDVHKTAMGNRTGTTDYYFRSPLDGGSNTCLNLSGQGFAKTVLPITTLDSFGIENVGLIKIDVEGFEKDVLEGAQETLRKSNYPTILFEAWKDSRDAEGLPASRLRRELFAYIHSIGYRIVPLNHWEEMFIAEKDRTIASG
jgi:FkbM family methyltransferase